MREGDETNEETLPMFKRGRETHRRQVAVEATRRIKKKPKRRVGGWFAAATSNIV